MQTQVLGGMSACLEVPRTHRTAAAMDFSRVFGLRTAHSQTVRTRQPSQASSATCLRSRARLPRNFSSQKDRRVRGITANRHPECWCQKQPCTNMTAEYFGRTISGRPGRSRRCRRYLSPALCSPVRRSRSGDVLAWRIFAMCRLRSSAERRSITQKTQRRQAHRKRSWQPELPATEVLRFPLGGTAPCDFHKTDSCLERSVVVRPPAR